MLPNHAQIRYQGVVPVSMDFAHHVRHKKTKQRGQRQIEKQEDSDIINVFQDKVDDS